jgi:hypothetical protein
MSTEAIASVKSPPVKAPPRFAERIHLQYRSHLLFLREIPPARPGGSADIPDPMGDAWCAFFEKHNFLVGLSVDGPHDTYRRDRRGQGRFDLVMQGWDSQSCDRSARHV